jgi:predicted dehydrogenase
MTSIRIGILGCGKVSHMYLPNLVRTPAVDIAAVADVAADAAKAVAEQYRIERAVSPDELLADPSIELVVNLTPIAVHVASTRAALQAGKHVYSEKSLATTVAEARHLLVEADERGLALGCAPDTLLGTGFSVARQALDDGRIGRTLSASAMMFRSAPGGPSFYTNGPTPFFDMAPYYLSALVSIFGPVTRVTGSTRTWPEGATRPDDPAGASIAIDGVLEFRDGATANLNLAWGTSRRGEVPVLDVYGSAGVLSFPNPNNFGDPAYIRAYDDTDRTELPDSRQPADWPRNLRGLGVAEMAIALTAGRTPRAAGDLAVHVVDIVAGLVESADTGRRVTLTTTCAAPEPMPAELRKELIA